MATLPSVEPLVPSLKVSGPKRMSLCMNSRISWSSEGALLEANLAPHCSAVVCSEESADCTSTWLGLGLGLAHPKPKPKPKPSPSPSPNPSLALALALALTLALTLALSRPS